MTLMPVVDDLELPGLAMSPTGVSRTGGVIDVAAVRDAFRAMPRIEAALHWTAGDLTLILAEELGGLPQALQQFADIEPMSQDRLAKAVNVCARIPLERRHVNLSFSHHEEVAHLTGDAQVRLLGRAESEHLSVRALRSMVRQEREDTEADVMPLPSIERLPRPPESALRAILAGDPDPWILWRPATGDLRAVNGPPDLLP